MECFLGTAKECPHCEAMACLVLVWVVDEWNLKICASFFEFVARLFGVVLMSFGSAGAL